jgi:hypothetical protein
MFGTFVMVGAALDDSKRRAEAAASSQAKRLSSSVGRDLKIVNANLDKIMLINEALWELMRDKHGLTENDLHKKMYEVDMRDGVLDGKNKRKAAECGQCGRMVSSRHPACLYCGTVIDNSVFTL